MNIFQSFSTSRLRENYENILIKKKNELAKNET